MGFFTTRERGDLDKAADEGEAKIRDFVRRDFAPRRRPPDNERDFVPRRRAPENDLVAGNAGALLAQVTGASIKQIDGLIVELKAHRERLLGEGARVQRAILEYAKMSQSTMQSTRIITESLSYWNRIPDAPKIADVDGAVDAAISRDEVARDFVARDFVARDLVARDLVARDLVARDLVARDLVVRDSGRTAEIERELERSVAAALAQPVEEPAKDIAKDIAEEISAGFAEEPVKELAEQATQQPAEEPVADAAAEPAATVLPDEPSAQSSQEPIAIVEAPSVVADRPDAETTPQKT